MTRDFRSWNYSPSSADRSTFPEDASNRIFGAYFTPEHLPDARRIAGDEGIFAMGSCFAREIETALRGRGFSILSMDLDLLAQGGFSDAKGVRTGFFHRFNVPAMELELRRAFDDIAFDEARDLLVEVSGGRFADLNYFPILERLDHAGMLARRRVAREMTRRFARARAIILTLGMTEAWFHEPSGMYCDGVAGNLLARRRSEFSLRTIGYEENYASLQRIYDFLERKHEDGDYSLFVTVSPVPLQVTFSDNDVVVANAASKATLRSVAGAFCAANEKAVYFPSYEIAMYSNPAKVWRPDRVHIQPRCVRHITSVFVDRYTDGRSVERAAAS